MKIVQARKYDVSGSWLWFVCKKGCLYAFNQVHKTKQGQDFLPASPVWRHLGGHRDAKENYQQGSQPFFLQVLMILSVSNHSRLSAACRAVFYVGKSMVELSTSCSVCVRLAQCVYLPHPLIYREIPFRMS